MGYKIKYYFDSETHHLFEVKNEDIKETDKSKIYSWVLFDKMKSDVKYLTFVSMGGEIRTFKEGCLIINNEAASLDIDGELLFFSKEKIDKHVYNKLINIIVGKLV